MKLSPLNDITTDRDWQLEQMDRLAAWEILQNSLGGGRAPLSERALGDRLAMPPKFWHGIIASLKRRLKNGE